MAYFFFPKKFVVGKVLEISFKISERERTWKGSLSTLGRAERKGKAFQFWLEGTERRCFPKKMDRLTCMLFLRKTFVKPQFYLFTLGLEIMLDPVWNYVAGFDVARAKRSPSAKTKKLKLKNKILMIWPGGNQTKAEVTILWGRLLGADLRSHDQLLWGESGHHHHHHKSE